MRVVTLPDGAQSVTVVPAGGGSPVFMGTADLAAGSGAALLAVKEDTTLAPTPLDATATVVIATVKITSQGNAFKLTYSGIVDLVLGTGAPPDATFSLFIDGNSVPEMGGEVGYTGADPATLNATFARTVWLFGQSPGAHTVELRGDLNGPTTSTATVAAALQLSVEDWLFPGP